MRAARAGGLTVAAAAVSTGSIPAVSKQQPGTGFELYLVVQAKTHVLYELSFRIDAAVLNQAPVFTRSPTTSGSSEA